MKKYIFYLSILIALSTFQAFGEDETIKWGAVTNGLQMAINLDNGMKDIKTNQPLVLLIDYRNVSTNESFHISLKNALEYDSSYSFVVISPSGKDISPTMEHEGQSGAWFVLEPNQTKEIRYNLSLLCNFGEMGTYKIVAKKSTYSFVKKKQFAVVSNPLNVTVVPGE